MVVIVLIMVREIRYCIRMCIARRESRVALQEDLFVLAAAIYYYMFVTACYSVVYNIIACIVVFILYGRVALQEDLFWLFVCVSRYDFLSDVYVYVISYGFSFLRTSSLGSFQKGVGTNRVVAEVPQLPQ